VVKEPNGILAGIVSGSHHRIEQQPLLDKRSLAIAVLSKEMNTTASLAFDLDPIS